jgi:hypothetical protein
MSLFTAMMTASVFALFGFPFRHYQCWFSFSRSGTVTGMVVYLGLAGGVGGLLGWLAAQGGGKVRNRQLTWSHSG